jgi:hypothetical protein
MTFFMALVAVVVLITGGIEMLLRRRDRRLAAAEVRKELVAMLREARAEEK